MDSVSRQRLNILWVSPIPPSPPRFGAQARIHGLMTELAMRHELTAVALLDNEFNVEECRKALWAYCSEVVLVQNPYGREGLVKRSQQIRSLLSNRSFERLRVAAPGLQKAIDRILATSRFDIVNLEFSYLGHLHLRRAPPGQKPPCLIVDSHEIAYDLARQFANAGGSLLRRLYAGVNWRKLRREELQAYRDADGVCLCSIADEQRLLNEIPSARTTVIPNAADVEYFQPRATDPKPDGRTVLYFGLLSTVPNEDAVIYFAEKIWPHVARAHPEAQLKIVGGRASPSVLALASAGIELTGFVSDLRPHLASAAAVVVPLRLGGGTRLKIVEAMAMGKAIVSTALGAEGIEVVPGRDILLEDQPVAFAEAVGRLLADPALAARIGNAARQLAVERYSWSSAAKLLEEFYRRILELRA